MLSAQFAARRGEDFPPCLQLSGNVISWKKVISVPPSRNNICRETFENILRKLFLVSRTHFVVFFTVVSLLLMFHLWILIVNSAFEFCILIL